jgi:hypothetical protein
MSSVAMSSVAMSSVAMSSVAMSSVAMAARPAMALRRVTLLGRLLTP